jgi:hypothetical protein
MPFLLYLASPGVDPTAILVSLCPEMVTPVVLDLRHTRF